MNDHPATPSHDGQPARYSTVLIVLTIIPLLGLAAALGLMLADATSQPGETTEFARVGSLDQPMPEFMLTTLDGEPFDLTQYSGRPMFVNFWGTWCPPCVDELPALQAFAASQEPDGAVVIASN